MKLKKNLKDINNEINLVKNYLKRCKKVLILFSDPDFDSVGSAIALKKILENQKIIADTFSEIKLNSFSFLDGVQEIIIKPLSSINFKIYDIVFILDTSDLNQLLSKSIKRKKDWSIEKEVASCKFVVNIDHHFSNKNFGKINIVNTNTSSTCEILFSIFEKEINSLCNKSILTSILAGLLWDTKQFKNINVNYKTFYLTGKLIKLGADYNFLNKKMFLSNKFKNVKQNAIVLKNMKLIKAGNYNYTYIKLKTSFEKTDDFLIAEEISRSVLESDFSLKITFYNKKAKISLKSNSYEILPLAKLFNGGGHKAAAGAMSLFSEKEILQKINFYLKKNSLVKI